uniref:Peptidase S1 domain-containing protein n=1 Tax=Anopheles culicifacies TaxID=139723 RepID=A0A182MVB2_9DIPT
MLNWQHCIALLCMVSACLKPALTIKASFERFEQYFGHEYIDLDLRVRKYNRTEMTLNGTIYVNQAIDETILVSSSICARTNMMAIIFLLNQFSTDVFHSRLGNQQFQHYPLHLPTGDICEFIKHVHEEYALAIVDIVNIPQISECPVTMRAMYVQDKTFPTVILPDSLANGLWKMVITGAINETIVIRYMISIRLNDDFFGI